MVPLQRPPVCTREIGFGAKARVYEKDFAEDENGHLNYRGSYIKALHLKWRKVD